ncbi:hypothetical protein [Granulicella sp. 5B5]|uniref:hypothetical protein n=1 Tax=Granulicella sp. 5B5 TaxID=1617967 RepID=UPI0015F6D3DE|nr:hypothetical protein [Granulicella sp. 5B5]
MSIAVDLNPDILSKLEEESRRSGETIDAIANRLLRKYFAIDDPRNRTAVGESFALETPEKWKGLTPKEIDYQMEIEAYEDKRDRARHESAAVRP